MRGDPLERKRWKPGVSKSVLLLLAGMTWIGVGIMLEGWSYSWLRKTNPIIFWLMSGSGFILALFIHHFGFLRIVDKNISRILPREGKLCLFSFIPWKSYVIIVIMILLGYGLRHSPVPKEYLAVLYTGIGLALMLSSIRYIRYLILEMKK